MPARFGPAARIRSHRQFAAVQQGGRRVGGRFVTVLGQPNTLGRHRLGLIASRRLGGAVRRNRTKRRLREIFRRHIAQDQGARGWDVVVIGRTGAAEAPFNDLTADVVSAVHRLHGAKRAST